MKARFVKARAHRRALALTVAVLLAGVLLGCNSSCATKETAIADGGARRGLDGGAHPRLDAASDGARGSDASTRGDGSAHDGEAGALASLYGDRNLGLSEPYPSSLQIQHGGRMYNVKSPPTAAQRAALGDGQTDDTGALRDAFDYLRNAYVAAANTLHVDPNGINDESNYWIYLPSGTYRVTDTVSYRDPIALADGGAYPDLVRIRIAGEDRETTTLKLDDSAAGFSDPTHPRVVLEYEHDGTTFNNWPASNLLTNVTIDVGAHNPGAAALWFQGANETILYNLRLTSADGSGFCGLLIQTGSTHGYYRDFTVSGFDNGICQIPTPNDPNATPNMDSDTAFEHVTLTGQAKAGVLMQAGGISLRRLLVDETASGAPALSLRQAGETVVLDASRLVGTGNGAAIQRDSAGAGQVLLARDVTTTGYASALSAAGDTILTGPDIQEYVSSAPFVLFDGGTPATLRLVVEDTPLVPWFDPATDWTSVDDFGAHGGADDSVAVQAAMNSGHAVVVFPRTRYSWSVPVTIPPSVQRVDFMYSDTPGELDIKEGSSLPLLLTHHNGGILKRTGARPLALTGYSGDLTNASSPPANLYLENVVNIGDQASFVPPGQSSWARFIDDEQPSVGQIDVWANGGSLWVFGFKMENKPVPVFVASNGAQLEVLNGEVAQTVDQENVFMIRNDNSSLSFIGFTELGYDPPFHAFTHIVEETRGDASAALITDGGFSPPLVARGWVPPGTKPVDLVVPLYSGRAAHPALADAGP